MYGYSSGLTKDEGTPSAGYGLAQVDPSQAPRIFKGLLVKPTDSARVAVATDERRPVLDEVTVNVARDTYLRRWDRAHAAGWLGTKPPAAPTTPVPATATTAVARSEEHTSELQSR